MNTDELKAIAIRASSHDGKPGLKKIEAIKQVREASGWGLKEAKGFVDSIDFNTGQFFKTPPPSTTPRLSLIILPREYLPELTQGIEHLHSMAMLSDSAERAVKLEKILTFLQNNR